jgi:hypothetical protein
MSFNADKLYNLLPGVYRIRDAEQGYALRQLVEVIAAQAAVLEESLDQLYDNHFVETAAPWVLPYIGDLLGIRGLTQYGVLPPRAEIGNTVAYRRRKGTASMLEQLARDITGYPARVVEFFDRLATTQHFNHVRPGNHAFVSIKDAKELELVNTPFEKATRTVEVRRIEPGLGKWNIPNVGIFLWRLQAYSLTRSPMVPALINGSVSDRHFRFHPLGLDIQLFSLPVTEREITHLAEPINAPMPLSRVMLRGLQSDNFKNLFHPSPNYYGPDGSVEIMGLQFSDILICDLSTWSADCYGSGNEVIDKKAVLLDPVLGRVIFPEKPESIPLATFHYGLSSNIGGGEYGRITSFVNSAETYAKVSFCVKGSAELEKTLIDAAEATRDTSVGSALVEIMDSGRYPMGISFDIGEGRLELRAADGFRPVVIMGKQRGSGTGVANVEINGTGCGSASLNGMLFSGAPLVIKGGFSRLHINHCSLFSHLGNSENGLPIRNTGVDACIEIQSSGTRVIFENSLLGPVKAGPGVRLQFRNCIIDARSTDNMALSDSCKNNGPSIWTLENCTVIGNVAVGILESASNTIFYGDNVFVQRCQQGCVRYSCLPSERQVPHQFRCVSGAEGFKPSFTSLEFNNPAYCQLGRSCPAEIRCGADDGAEMGAFHDLMQPQREASLRDQLREYLRFGLDAGVFYVN